MLGLNQAAVEALYSASYVENYLDCVENLPDDIQRSITQLRELDQKYQETLEELEQYQEALQREQDQSSRKRTLLQMQRALIQSQEIGDDKIEILQQIQDLVENKGRQLELDYKNLDLGQDADTHPDPTRVDPQQPERSSKRSRRQRQHEAFLRDDLLQDRPEKDTYIDTSSLKKKKKKKRKSKVESSPVEPPIDPDEPTYCLCEQVSFGEMIGCDNQECPIEWFHFSCVALTTKPKGKWFCPKCRGDRSNQMKPKH